MKSLIIALRTIKNYRFYSIVNIIGLTLSLACVITLLRYIYSEVSVDTCHSQYNNIYGVTRQTEDADIPYPGASLALFNDTNFRDITNEAAVIHKTTTILVKDEAMEMDNIQSSANVLVGDSCLTDVFDFPVAVGSLTEVTHSVDKAAVTREFATKLCGNTDPLGRSFLLKQRTYVIAAILDKPTTKISFNFDMILPYVDFHQWQRMPEQYVILSPAANYREINSRYADFITDGKSGRAGVRYNFVPFKEYYSGSVVKFHEDTHATGNRQSMMVLGIIAAVVMLIGLLNFINIYTVLMLRRTREVGVKKVFGASTTSIATGIYLENLVMVTISIVGGWMLSLICQEFTQGTLGIPIVANRLYDTTLSLSLLILLPLATAFYPYIKYRYAKPITSLHEIGTTRKSIISRAVLLVIQYVMTIVTVIVSIYFVRQLNFMLATDLGYTSKNIISADVIYMNKSYPSTDDQWREQMKETDKMGSKIKIMEQQLNESPIIKAWSYAEAPNHIDPKAYGTIQRLPDGDQVPFSYLLCNNDYFDIYGLKLIEGRPWNDSIDVFSQYRCIVNREMLRQCGITDFTTTQLQTSGRMWYSFRNEAERELMNQNPPYEIIGVIEDFQIGHLSKRTAPLMIMYSNSETNPAMQTPIPKLNVLVDDQNQAQVIALLEKMSIELGNTNFSYTTIEDEIATQYTEERRIANIYSTFAIIAILISSLGLLSLSLYDVQQRYREIALRRVNGATVRNIMAMLLRKYYLLLGISFVIAIPLAWWAIDWYVRDFATRAPLAWWIFALAAVFTAAISLLTLIYQIRKAATQNPAIAMKRE